MTKCTACLSSCLSNALLFCSAFGGLLASFSPCSRAKASKQSVGNTRLASPSRSASLASMTSASSSNSAAFRWPTALGNSKLEANSGTSPSSTNGSCSRALSPR
ncbi:hypothetical protein D3C79_846770 [compost metagenome]